MRILLALLFLLFIPVAAADFPASIRQDITPQPLAPGGQATAHISLIDIRGRSVEGQVSVFLIAPSGREIFARSHNVAENLTFEAPQEQGAYTLRSTFGNLDERTVVQVGEENRHKVSFTLLAVLFVSFAVLLLGIRQAGA